MSNETPTTDGEWMRPLKGLEGLLELLHQKGYMVTCYSLTLNAKELLVESQLRQSLLHLYRKVPSLRVCIQKHDDGNLWFRQMKREMVDFEILQDADYEMEYLAMTKRHYDTHKGPLWCVRLLPIPQGAECAMPSVQRDFPHQYILLFGFHHSMTDGTSSIRICDFFMRILNQVIAKQSIDDLEQLADFVSNEQTEVLIAEALQQLKNDPAEVARLTAMAQGKIEDVGLLKVFPSPVDVTPQTSNLPYSVNERETRNFLVRCKTERVTIHSAFCAVINAALVDLMVEGGLQDEKFRIKSYHTLNNRRYWQGDTSRAFGAHLGKLTIVCYVGRNIDTFWSDARDFHATFNDLLTTKDSIKEDAFMQLFVSTQKADLEKMLEAWIMNDQYYGTTNMGDLRQVFPGEGDHVQVTDFRRTTSTTKNLCSHVWQTFRGRFLYGLDYEASLISPETASRYVKAIFKTFKTVTYMK